MRYMVIKYEGFDIFEEEYQDGSSAIRWAKWCYYDHWSSSEKKRYYVEAVIVPDNYGEDIGGGATMSDVLKVLWTSKGAA